MSAVSGGAPSDPTSTAVPAISPPEFPDDFVVPSGYETLIDDTGHLSVAVPEHWDDIDLAPFEFDGSEVPWINAATNLRVWDETFAAPGVLYAAFPFDAEVEAVYARFELTSGCAALEVVPYDDGAFSGQWWQHTQCGPEGASQWHAIVASPASDDATIVVIVQLATAADRPALGVVLQSFNFTPTATWPTATVATTTTAMTSTTTSTVAPTASTSTASSTSVGTRFIVDDTNLLSVTVPDSWTDVTTASGANDDGTDRPTILAGPDARRFLAGFDVPGTRIVALPPNVEPATVLANNAYSDNCSSDGTAPFDNGRFAGLIEEWTGCAGGDTSLTVVAARPPDNSFTILAEVQETSDDRSATSILDSIALVAGSTYPATTLPAPVTPVGVVPDTLLHGSVQPGAATVVDSSGSISVAVPADWSERRLGGTFNDDMSSRAADHRRPECRRLARWVDDARRDLRRVSVHGRSRRAARQPGVGGRLRRRWRADVRQRHVHRLPADVEWVRRHRDAHRLGGGEPGGSVRDPAPRGAAPDGRRHAAAVRIGLVRAALSGSAGRRVDVEQRPQVAAGPRHVATGSSRSGTRRRPQPPRS